MGALYCYYYYYYYYYYYISTSYTFSNAIFHFHLKRLSSSNLKQAVTKLCTGLLLLITTAATLLTTIILPLDASVFCMYRINLIGGTQCPYYKCELYIRTLL